MDNSSWIVSWQINSSEALVEKASPKFSNTFQTNQKVPKKFLNTLGPVPNSQKVPKKFSKSSQKSWKRLQVSKLPHKCLKFFRIVSPLPGPKCSKSSQKVLKRTLSNSSQQLSKVIESSQAQTYQNVFKLYQPTYESVLKELDCCFTVEVW